MTDKTTKTDQALDAQLTFNKIASLCRAGYLASDSAMTNKMSDSDFQNLFETIEGLAKNGAQELS